MNTDDDLGGNTVKILELMASKICHDLISPVGAIANGIEIMEEMGEDENDEIINLISFSASQAASKLKTMRMAYGIDGSDSSIKIEEVHKVFGEFILSEKRLSQDWDPHSFSDLKLSENGFAKILLCTLMLAIEAMPKGGIVRVYTDNENTLCIEGEGEHAGLKDDFVHALEHSISPDDLEPKLVHAYVTGLLAHHHSFEIKHDNTKNNFIILRLANSTVS